MSHERQPPVRPNNPVGPTLMDTQPWDLDLEDILNSPMMSPQPRASTSLNTPVYQAEPEANRVPNHSPTFSDISSGEFAEGAADADRMIQGTDGFNWYRFPPPSPPIPGHAPRTPPGTPPPPPIIRTQRAPGSLITDASGEAIRLNAEIISARARVVYCPLSPAAAKPTPIVGSDGLFIIWSPSTFQLSAYAVANLNLYYKFEMPVNLIGTIAPFPHTNVMRKKMDHLEFSAIHEYDRGIILTIHNYSDNPTLINRGDDIGLLSFRKVTPTDLVNKADPQSSVQRPGYMAFVSPMATRDSSYWEPSRDPSSGRASVMSVATHSTGVTSAPAATPTGRGSMTLLAGGSEPTFASLETCNYGHSLLRPACRADICCEGDAMRRWERTCRWIQDAYDLHRETGEPAWMGEPHYCQPASSAWASL